MIKTLKKALEKRNVKIVLNTKVLNIDIKDGICHGVIVQSGDKSGSYTADKVIVATGGCSYQSTGSTGDGYRFAKDADIKVTKCYPSLFRLISVQIYQKDCRDFPLEMSK